VSCGRVRREILDTVRFGEIGPGSSPHLEHLSRCAACRDEVGFDRALVAQLRRALEARVDPLTPPSRAWSAILRETQRPARRTSVWGWSASPVDRLRTATAMAGTGLALLVALNMEVVPAAAPSAPPVDRTDDVTLQQIPRMPTGRTALVALANLSEERGALSQLGPDPERQLTQPDARVAPRERPQADIAEAPADDDGGSAPAVLLIRPLQTPERELNDASSHAIGKDDAPDGDAVDFGPGEPS
jgi:anti-sigma factor RsiW